MADISAQPHGAHHIDEGCTGLGMKASGDFLRQPVAREQYRAIAVIKMRQHRVLGHEGQHIDGGHRSPHTRKPCEAGAIDPR